MKEAADTEEEDVGDGGGGGEVEGPEPTEPFIGPVSHLAGNTLVH